MPSTGKNIPENLFSARGKIQKISSFLKINALSASAPPLSRVSQISLTGAIASVKTPKPRRISKRPPRSRPGTIANCSRNRLASRRVGGSFFGTNPVYRKRQVVFADVRPFEIPIDRVFVGNARRDVGGCPALAVKKRCVSSFCVVPLFYRLHFRNIGGALFLASTISHKTLNRLFTTV